MASRFAPTPRTERETGLEPATPSLEGWRSTRLSYSRLVPWCAQSSPVRERVCYHPSRRSPSRCEEAVCASHAGDSLGEQSPSGEWRIRTSVGISRQIYSLLPLAARATLPLIQTRAGARIRTADLLITNQLLSQLSYASPLATLTKSDRCGSAQRNARGRGLLCRRNYRFCSQARQAWPRRLAAPRSMSAPDHERGDACGERD